MAVGTAVGDLSATIKRLHKGKQEHWEEGKAEGRKDGEQWARDKADYHSLIQVCEGADLIWETLRELAGCDYEEVRAVADVGGHEPDAFCDGYFEGFTEGAQSIWNQVKGKI